MVHGAAGELVCCGQSMQLMEENTVDAAAEKHVPVIEKSDGKIIVKVGEAPHPMAEDHYIEWIELLAGDNIVDRVYLKPGDSPEAIFSAVEGSLIARAYCNLHGLWKS